MIAVIFESWPHPDQKANYLDAAAELRPLLAGFDGFISVERFESLTEPGKILSLSFWRDEAAVAKWRQVEQHRDVQSRARKGIFANYRLRVASVMRDYERVERREEAPADSQAVHR